MYHLTKLKEKAFKLAYWNIMAFKASIHSGKK
jgi:hypothetical protein